MCACCSLKVFVWANRAEVWAAAASFDLESFDRASWSYAEISYETELDMKIVTYLRL